MDSRDARGRPGPPRPECWGARLPEGIFELLRACPRVRPGVVARTKALLASRVLPPEAAEVARGVVERLVAERVT